MGKSPSGKKHDPGTSISAKSVPFPVAPILVIAGLSLLVLAVYGQTGSHAFITLDDAEYVYRNPRVAGGLTTDGIRWAFTAFHAANWHPLTWLSHMTDVELFGLEAGRHHLVNVLLHLANTILLFLILRRSTGGLWRSAFVAALFAVHPLHVESVAWVAERKDVLSTLFWLLTMGAYVRYARKPGAARYLSVAALFALGLMCKPMLVTLPFVLLLLDWWPLGRLSPGTLGRRVLEKAPLLALSAASCVVTYMAQSHGKAVVSLGKITAGLRLSNALTSCAIYLEKAVWPSSLAVFYPHQGTIGAGIPAWKIAGAAVLLAGISFLAFRERHRRPYLAVGWLWYLGTLVPVIGLVQVGDAAYSDRYTYVPLIGVFLAVAWAVPELFPKRRWRQAALGVSAGVVLAALSVAAFFQTGYWRDNMTLYSRALAVTERNWLVLLNLGAVYEDRGEHSQAIAYFLEALRFKPDIPEAWYNLGAASGKLGREQEAIGYYREALRLNPEYASAWYNMGLIQARLGRVEEAAGNFAEAVRIAPDHGNAWYNLGFAYLNLGRVPEAITCFRETVRVKPDFAEAWYNLGMIYEKLGRRREAEDSFREAERLQGR